MPEQFTKPGLIVHGTGPHEEVWLPNAIRAAQNASIDLGEGIPIELVVQGPAVKLLTTAEGLSSDISVLLDTGIAVQACGNSLRSASLGRGDLIDGVGMVSAAVGHLARRQWAGWAYVRI